MTEQDFLNIIENKISNEMQKAIIRRNYAPQLADLLCNAIDSKEKTDLFKNLWMNGLNINANSSK